MIAHCLVSLGFVSALIIQYNNVVKVTGRPASCWGLSITAMLNAQILLDYFSFYVGKALAIASEQSLIKMAEGESRGSGGQSSLTTPP